ncbi:FIST C-terminal domain-containing protein [Lachnospiraceae bacterium ZAX-1]
MIKAITAYTNEVDDVEVAVQEILEQLDMDNNLLKNTVGTLICYSEFIDSTVVSSICESLPFEVVGTTTLLNAVPESSGTMLLTLMALTSDDVYFSVGLTEAIESEDDTPLRAGYEAAKAKLPGKPVLILSFAPLLMNVGGDFYVDAVNEISGGVPNFGTISIDHNDDYHEARIIHNGESYVDRYAFVLVSGNVQPRFFIGSISSEKIFQEKGIVTASHSNQLLTVNNIPVVDYLQTLGLNKNEDGTITGINSFPFIVDYNDGTTPVVRVMFALTPEGYAVCGGNIPVGAILSVGSIDADEIIATTTARLTDALAVGKSDCFLMFSCAGRYFSLGYNPDSEIDKVQSLMQNTGIPYQFAYSGGELCPVYTKDEMGVTTNRNHNDTYVICVL